MGSNMKSNFRSLSPSSERVKRCDDVCGNLKECYIENNIEKAMGPEHRTLNKDIVAQEYKDLFHNYWDAKIQNISVTEQGIIFAKFFQGFRVPKEKKY